jgi:cytochrome c peroxidase
MRSVAGRGRKIESRIWLRLDDLGGGRYLDTPSNRDHNASHRSHPRVQRTGCGTIGVSKRNIPGNPVMDFIVTNDDGTTVAFSSPDPGMVLTNPRIANPATPKSFGINLFRTPILRGITKTAPYFHDNSAKTLEDVAAHYTFFFQDSTGINNAGGLTLTPQDEADMVAFMKLL